MSGSTHPLEKCYYLVDSIRPQGWILKDSGEKKFAKQRKNPEMLAKFNAIRKKAGLPEWTAEGASANVVASIPTQSISEGVFSAVVSTTTSQPLTSQNLKNTFILDSGATTHVCNDRSRFTGFRQAMEWIRHGDSGTWISGYGDVDIQMISPDGKGFKRITLGNSAYCPDFLVNIASFPRFFDRQLFWDTERGMLYRHGKDLARVEKQGNLFILENEDKWISDHSANANAAPKMSSKPLISKAPAEIWHRRLGHMYYGSMAKLPKVVDGIAISGSQPNERCPPCEFSKAKSQISRRPTKRATRPGERVHFDLVDNMIAYNGRRYSCHFLDDATRMHVAYTLNSRSQDDVMKAILAFAKLMERQWGCKVAIFKMDGERALGKNVYTFCKMEGIAWTESLPYMPEQNGPAERVGKAIAERARTLIVDGKIPKSLWPEAFNAAVHILNRTPTRILKEGGGHEWIIPIQRMYALTTGEHMRPNLANLRLYGCRAYVKLSEKEQGSKRDKMAPRATVGYLVGFVASNIWRIWLPEKQEVISARDVKFDETKQYEPNDPFATAVKVPGYGPNRPAVAPPKPPLTNSRSEEHIPAPAVELMPPTEGVTSRVIEQQPVDRNPSQQGG